MQNFFSPPEHFSGTIVSLTDDEYFHATRSCRVRIGEVIGVTDGRGKRVHARIETIDAKHLTASIERDISGIGEPDRELTLALAVIKANRFELAVEKCTELGIRHFVPLITTRCEPNSARRLKSDRLERIILEASKQSCRSWIPDISEPEDFDTFIDRIHEPVLVASQHAEQHLLTVLGDSEKSEKITIIIGPEGDFSDDEYSMLTDAGVVRFSLGGLTLRSETAAVTAAAFALAGNEMYSDVG